MTAKLRNILTVCLTAAILFGCTVWSLLTPDADISAAERRPLASFPEVSGSAIADGTFMTDFEQYTLDQFPARDAFRSLQALTSRYVLGQQDNNDIYLAEGYVSKLEFPLDEKSLSYAAGRFRFVYEQYFKEHGGNVYLSIIPDKNYFLAAPNGYPALDYDRLIAVMKEEMDYADYIDILPLLELSDYYRTDTHWRQEAIEDVAAQLATGMGVTLSADFTPVTAEEPFYGVYYGQAALPMAADELTYMTFAGLDDCRVYDYETSSYIPVYATEKSAGLDPYELFLSGSKSLLTIENPGATGDKELVIFRDSFGSSIAPLLIPAYKTITLVDIRYISPNVLGNFVTLGEQDVLFLYSTGVLNNSVTIK